MPSTVSLASCLSGHSLVRYGSLSVRLSRRTNESLPSLLWLGALLLDTLLPATVVLPQAAVRKLVLKIVAARQSVAEIPVDDMALEKIVTIPSALSLDGHHAEVVLEPTASVERAARCLLEIPVGGKTQLRAGLLEACRLLERVEAAGDMVSCCSCHRWPRQSGHDRHVT